MVEFFWLVRDQVTLLVPERLADKHHPYYYAPRLEAWIVGCDLMGVPPHMRARLIEQARVLHRAFEGRAKIPGLRLMPPEELAPPDED